MAKQQTVRSTIGRDPFETLIPDRIAEQAEVIQHPSSPRDQDDDKKGHKKEKITVHLTHDLIERIKNAAYWDPRLTIASIAEIGVRYALEQVEKKNGGPYPPRECELKGGRPIGS